MRRHAKSLVNLIKEICPPTPYGAEVGVWRGHTSQAIFENVPGAHLIMVDLWGDCGDLNSAMPSANGLVEFEAAEKEARERTSAWEERRFIARAISSACPLPIPPWPLLDFVFLDAGHSYEDVRDDLEHWCSKLKAGGLFCGHDYNGVGDRTKGWGVKQAVDEFAAEIGMNISTRRGNVWWGIRPELVNL